MKEYGDKGPCAVICKNSLAHTAPLRVFLTPEQYKKQLMVVDSKWKCPICRCEAQWDDDNYEKFLEA